MEFTTTELTVIQKALRVYKTTTSSENRTPSFNDDQVEELNSKIRGAINSAAIQKRLPLREDLSKYFTSSPIV